jgi:large subunit ribosomal protein L15
MKLKLSKLSFGIHSKKTKKRVGRGEGSGVGKTSRRGGKGQTARTGGKVAAHFEGGQMPLYRRIPKLGFSSRKSLNNKNAYHVINLSQLESFDDGSSINLIQASSLGIGINSVKHGAGVKLLGSGSISKRIVVEVNAASRSAIEAVRKSGGEVKIVTAK